MNFSWVLIVFLLVTDGSELVQHNTGLVFDSADECIRVASEIQKEHVDGMLKYDATGRFAIFKFSCAPQKR